MPSLRTQRLFLLSLPLWLAVPATLMLGCGGGGTKAGDGGATMDDSGAGPDLSGLPEACRDGKKDGDESDVDCGGSECVPCADGADCLRGTDCASALCTNNLCAAASCTDGVRNGGEGDVDCGGSCPDACDLGQSCKRGTDCKSGTCSNNACAQSPCRNGVQDGDESDVDCGGGSCPRCAEGKACLRGADCATYACTNNVCKLGPSCANGATDGSETGIDCGGASCPPCADGQGCLVAGDCQSAYCANNLCKPNPSCGNGKKDGGETDVDCGGGCGPCDGGQRCQSADDCKSRQCQGGVCAKQAALCPDVMLVLDQSGSMADAPVSGSTTSKWNLLVGAVQTVLASYGDQLAFGLELFTDDSTCLFSCTDAQCYEQTAINIQPGADTATSIMAKLNASGPDGGTNTGYAIRRALEAFSADTSGRDRYLVLVTDGDPTTCSATEPQYTYSQIQSGASASPAVHTFVIGFDGNNGVKPDYLDQMAQAGGEPKPGCSPPTTHCYYSATSGQTLDSSLAQVLSAIAVPGCTP